MNTITFIAIYFGASLVFMVLVFTLLIRSKRKQRNRFESDWTEFQKSLQKEDIDQINFYGSRVIWNHHKAEPQHKKIVLDEISKRKEIHTELKKLWKDAFYLVHGTEPN